MLGTVFSGYAYGITLGFDKVIEMDFSYIYFEVCIDGNLEGLVKGSRYGTNDGVG